MNTKKKFNPDRIAVWVIVLIVAILGSGIRLYIVTANDFPLNDGGLFYQMTEDLMGNDYRFPQYTTYNHLDIPFAYPPLPFYLTGLLAELLNVDIVTLFRFLPVCFSIFSILAFFLLARIILNTDFNALIAMLIFTLLPTSYEWEIMGGGLTRAPAFMFSILSLGQLIRTLKFKSTGSMVLTAVFLALTGYCHLGILRITVVWMIVTVPFFMVGIKKMVWLLAGIFGVCGLLMLPYVFTVWVNHGPQPFLAAFSSGEMNRTSSVARFLLVTVTNEIASTPILLFAMLASLRCAFKKDYFLLVLLASTVLLDPRSMLRSLSITISLLAAVGIRDVIMPGLLLGIGTLSEDSQKASKNISNTAFRIISMAMITFIIVRAGVFSGVYSQLLALSLSMPSRISMHWVSTNTPETAKFILLTGSQEWETDMQSEWFPALADRSSILTIQGTEWLPTGTLEQRRDIYLDIAKCIASGLKCVEQVAVENNLDFDYIYMGETDDSNDVLLSGFIDLKYEMLASPDYTLVYQNDTIYIFKKNS